MTINLTRVDGAMAVTPIPDYISAYLQYSHRSFGLQGWKRVNKFEKKELFAITEPGRLITFAGFFDRVYDLIVKNGDMAVITDLRTPVKEPNLAAVKNINWEGIGGTGLRDYQVDPVVEFLFKVKDGNGLGCCAGAWGKTILMATTYAAFKHIGSTIIAVPLKAIFDQTYDKFCKLFPDQHIGRVGDGYCDISSDLTITTYKSLPKAPIEKCKLLLMDEVQCTTSEGITKILSGITPVRMLGFTATDKNLFNGADKLIKGLFGERLIHIPYTEAEGLGAVVPFLVYMVRVPDLAAFEAGTVEAKIIRGIKRCEIRNKLVGEVCQLVPEDWQTIVFVDHIADHLIPLYRFMPEGTCFVHRGQDKELGSFAMTGKKQDKVLKQFQDEEYKFLLTTDCMRAGKDIPQIKVVVQASGGTSEVELLQEAFRGARTAPGKEFAVLIDFYDQHEQTLENMSLKRMEIYKKQGWKVKIVDSPKDIVWAQTNDPPKLL